MKELPHKAAQLRLSVASRVYRLSGGSSFKLSAAFVNEGRFASLGRVSPEA
jgi:hypothetical protein